MADKVDIYQLTLNRMNITWEPDEKQAANVRTAIEEAQALLRDRAGKSDLDLSVPEYRGLWVDCAWYLYNNRYVEFLEDYLGPLNTLRLAEGMGCGYEEEIIL